MSEGVVGLGRVQVRRPISASSAIAASSPIARRAPLQTWPQAKVGTWTRRSRDVSLVEGRNFVTVLNYM